MTSFRVFGSTERTESAREINHRKLARQAAADGMVLLKNEGILPLSERNIALYGNGARMTVRGGSGSGDVRERYSVNIEQGLKNAGFSIDNTRWLERFDQTYKNSRVKWRSDIEDKIKHIEMSEVQSIFQTIDKNPFYWPAGDLINTDDLAQNAKTAIYVLARQAGEGGDRKVDKGDYLVDDIELANLKTLANYYDNLILVINCGGSIDLSCIDEVDNIGAIIYFVQAGTEGGNALADIITGRVVPNGKLTSTWGMKYSDYPSADSFSYLNGNLDDEDYLEGIYVGYRYFDSFEIEPRYEFGFGLSYADFEHEMLACKTDKGIISATIRVKNSSKKHAGREIVQLYLAKPTCQIDREVKSLAAFAKTNLIEPNNYEDIEISFNISDHASYYSDKAIWILASGNYGLLIGSSSKKNTLSAIITVEEDVITDQTKNICPLSRTFQDMKSDNNFSFQSDILPVMQISVSDISTKKHDYNPNYHTFTKKVNDVLESLSPDKIASLCVGGDMFGLAYNNTPGACGRTSTTLTDNGIPNINMSDGPAGLNVLPKTVFTDDGTQKFLDEMPDSYNWGCLKQMTSIAVAKETDGRPVFQYMTAWPVSTLLAQTWDINLMEKIGEAVGKEMLEIGVTLWLAPAINIQRNPLCGRNFEYFSEDPVLSGMMAAAIINGVQRFEGIGATVKHFCCNNQENNREYVSENVSERALREIYLKAFGIVIRESRPRAVMSSYNKVNGEYTANSYDLLTNVLRHEWGFDGVVMSDWHAVQIGDRAAVERCHDAGNDLIMPGSKEITEHLIKKMNEGVVNYKDIKRSAGHILELILGSAVYKND